MWFFWTEEGETPLTKAVIHDDWATMKSLGKMKDHVLARNFLGFNALEIARYLGKKEALRIFSCESTCKHKVMFPQETKVVELTKEEFERHFKIKYISHLKFIDYAFFKKVIKSGSWVFNKRFLDTDMLKLFDQYQSKISSGYFADVIIKWIDDSLQYGVFAARDINVGEYIGEYIGIIHQMYRFRPHFNEYCLHYPLFPSFRYFLTDSKFEGNKSRFLNHSFEPNLELKVAAENGLLHCIFFANQMINAGSQLTFNYGEDYWSRRNPPQEI
jgi:hypothetical protein